MRNFAQMTPKIRQLLRRRVVNVTRSSPCSSFGERDQKDRVGDGDADCHDAASRHYWTASSA
jgi:hypothetical protein